MTVIRVSIPDDIYNGYGKLLGCRDAGPGITGFLGGYLAFLNGYRPFPIEPIIESPSEEDKDYSAEWEALELGDDPDDDVLAEAKAYLIARKGEMGALSWAQAKKANGIERIPAFLVKWYRDNKK